MKRALFGGILTLMGNIWALAVFFIAGNNLEDAWYPELGKFWTVVIEMHLEFLLVFSAVLIVLGMIILAAELYPKKK